MYYRIVGSGICTVDITKDVLTWCLSSKKAVSSFGIAATLTRCMRHAALRSPRLAPPAELRRSHQLDDAGKQLQPAALSQAVGTAPQSSTTCTTKTLSPPPLLICRFLCSQHGAGAAGSGPWGIPPQGCHWRRHQSNTRHRRSGNLHIHHPEHLDQAERRRVRYLHEVGDYDCDFWCVRSRVEIS